MFRTLPRGYPWWSLERSLHPVDHIYGLFKLSLPPRLSVTLAYFLDPLTCSTPVSLAGSRQRSRLTRTLFPLISSFWTYNLDSIWMSHHWLILDHQTRKNTSMNFTQRTKSNLFSTSNGRAHHLQRQDIVHLPYTIGYSTSSKSICVAVCSIIGLAFLLKTVLLRSLAPRNGLSFSSAYTL